MPPGTSTMPEQQQDKEDKEKENVTVDVTAATARVDLDFRGTGIDRRDCNNKARQQKRFSDFSTATDEEFRKNLRELLNENPLASQYPDLFARAPDCFVRWRQRYSVTNPKLWKRLFTTEKVLKEFFEAVPVLDAVVTMIETDTRLNKNGTTPQSYTIIDLCSGKGYLGMILSEMLPPSKVFRIILMDKAWPMRNAPMKSKHINWEHIYGSYESQCSAVSDANSNTTGNNEKEEKKDDEDDGDFKAEKLKNSSAKPKNPACSSYYDTWPIPIDTSKQDLKSSRQLRQIKLHYLSNPSEHPVIMLAIHLCGTLSLRAVELFNTNPSIKFLALKPCCLPGMIHSKRHEVFRIGSHEFDAKSVCVHGKWNKNKWENGPPRSHLQKKFQIWSKHLYQGIGYGSKKGATTEQSNDNTDTEDRNPNKDAKPQNLEEDDVREAGDKVRKLHAKVTVQHDGGFQNEFLFAERIPISSISVWDGLNQNSI